MSVFKLPDELAFIANRRAIQKTTTASMARTPCCLTGSTPGARLAAAIRLALPGARITLDGRLMDVAPVLLTKAVPGKHLLGATIDGTNDSYI